MHWLCAIESTKNMCAMWNCFDLQRRRKPHLNADDSDTLSSTLPLLWVQIRRTGLTTTWYQIRRSTRASVVMKCSACAQPEGTLRDRITSQKSLRHSISGRAHFHRQFDYTIRTRLQQNTSTVTSFCQVIFSCLITRGRGYQQCILFEYGTVHVYMQCINNKYVWF